MTDEFGSRGVTRALSVIAEAAVAGATVDANAMDGRLSASDWATLPSEAEFHQIGPLARAALTGHPFVPGATSREFEALALRHRARHRELTTALVEILDTFARNGIDTVVLKGAALAWTIYPFPEIRPMGDIDVLVPGPAAHAAQLSLKRMGFEAADAPRPFGRNAHHLPVTTRTQNGVSVSVEIHRDALSRDTFRSIAFDGFSEPPRRFELKGVAAQALGHVDALRHLAHHLLEPSWSGHIRLLSVVDLLRYAATFRDEIDWDGLRAAHPFVLNVLRCSHYVVPLPAPLVAFAPSSAVPIPGRIGETVRPLRSLHNLGRDVSNPPAWWLHAYYNVPLDRSLVGVRCARHPWSVARWLALRAVGW